MQLSHYLFLIVLITFCSNINSRTSAGQITSIKPPIILSSTGSSNGNNNKGDKNATYCSRLAYWDQYMALPIQANSIQPNNVPIFNLTTWIGRFGNHFIQLRLILRWGYCCKGILIISTKDSESFPNLHRYFDFTSSESNKKAATHHLCHSQNGSFWYNTMQHAAFSHPSCKYDEEAAIRRYYLNQSCPLHSICSNKISNDNDNNYNKDDRELVVHIRSGDIFCSDSKSISGYKQPPVAFYEAIFKLQQWTSVIFVTQQVSMRCLNPVWIYYMDITNRKHFRDAEVRFEMSTNMKEDLKILMAAQYYVAPISTFPHFILSFSSCLKEAYFPHHKWFRKLVRDDVQSYIINLHNKIEYNYYEAWNHSAIQVEQLTSYSNPFNSTIVLASVKNSERVFWGS